MSALATRIFRGREAVAALDPADRGLAYGDGLFETMRVAGGCIPWWDAHLARLARSAQVLGLPAPDAGWLQAQCQDLIDAAPEQAVLKLVLTRGAGGRGYRAPDAPTPISAPSSQVTRLPPRRKTAGPRPSSPPAFWLA